MINKNYTSDIRTCQRIKFDQALYILTMYEKKIRKNRQSIIKKSVNEQKGVDAEQQLQDITYAWKNKWKLDLTKPVLNCVTSVYPRILVDYGNQKSYQLRGFYYTLGKFIKRLRAQHEDETNYKFVLNSYDKTTMISGQNNINEGYSNSHNSNQELQQQQQKLPSQSIIYGDEQQKSQRQKLKLLNCAKSAVNSVLNVCYNMANSSIKHFEENFEYIVNEDIADVDTQGLEWQVIRPLRFVRQVLKRALLGDNKDNQQPQQQQMQQQPPTQLNPTLQPQSQQSSQLMTFSHNVIKILQRIKQSQHGSTLITIQPQIKQLTYIIHPLLVAIYAMFKKQNLQKQKDMDWRQNVPIQTNKFMDNAKSSYNLSKVVLINLDGYESQFNLQLVRNFKKHLMYISFPKQQAILNDLQKVYSKRFFKKLMFYYTQSLYQSYPSENLSQQMKHIAKLQQLNYNPQNYHYFTQQMYQQSQHGSSDDFNQNMYIFPVRYKGLKQHFPQLFQQTEKQDIEQYESYFIKFIMRDFLINQIREFNPSYIMISYSGRLTIQDSHFVDIIQQLTKVGNYKLVMYPNMTTGFCTQEMMVVEDSEGNQCDYDGGVVDGRVRDLLEACTVGKNKVNTNRNDNGQGQNMQQEQQGGQQEQNENEQMSHKVTKQSSSTSTSIIQLFNKLSRFLKVSSGTYNLTRTTQQDPLISKFKNQFILTYTDELMTTLGKEYYSIDRIRFKNKDLAIIPKLFEQNLNAIKKSFGKTVPEFYCDLYRVLEGMLFNLSDNNNKSVQNDNTLNINNNNTNKQCQQLLTSYNINPKHYQHDITELWQQLTKSSSIQISSQNHKHYDNSNNHQQHSLMNQNYNNMMMMSQQSSSSMNGNNSYNSLLEMSGNQNYQVIRSQQKKDLVEQIEQLKIKKNKRQFLALKQLHFIEISSQKYQDKSSIYIKKHSQLKQFNTITEQSQQTQGLYDVTFLRKDKTQLKLFETTKILYKTNQRQRDANTIPIMVMNNLSDQKPGYFQNYMADLDVSQQPNKQRKNIQQKKALVLPITMKQLDGRVVNMKSFSVKSEWNFYQTKEYIVLYWPTQFDYLRSVIYKMLNKTYSPSISDGIYISKKSSPQRNLFKRVNILSQTMVIPRMGCSAYQFQSRLFVFGGFYAKQLNYLEFQHDVTMVDLRGYSDDANNKIRVDNLKGVLYSQENFNRLIAQSNSYNSYIRPRMEFQIYDKNELADWYQDSPEFISIILFGGYGQNFIRPFSLLTYYYYEIKFSHETRNIVSIHKKIIYDKTVPINVKEMTKNLGVIKTNKKNPNTNVLQTNKITEPGSYLTFRNCFKIQKNADDVEDFKYKFRYMFAEDEHKSFKTEIKKVQQQRTQQFDSSSITVQKMQGNNHLISLQKDGKKCVICLHLQIPYQKAKKLGCSRQVKLTHQSIVYIDFWNSMICAIIKHDFYTRGKSVLVEYNIKSLQNLSFNHDQIPHIALTWMKQFDYNLSRHILIACNKNTIAILHGQKLLNSEKIKEFIVKKKKNKTEAIAYEILQRPPMMNLSLPNPEYCTSIFFKQRNKILSLQYFSDSRNSLIIEVAYQIELNSANDVYSWQSPSERGDKGQANRQCVTCYRVVTEGARMTVGWHKMGIDEYFKVQKDQQSSEANKNKRPTERIILVTYNKKSYYLQLGGIGLSQKGSIQVLQLISTEKLKLQKQSAEKGTILSKSISQYYQIL